MLSLLAANGAGRLSRRQFFRLGSAGLAGSMSWASPLSAAPATPRKAKHCIYIFLCGGPSQHDLWDPKPDAPDGIRSDFCSIQTSVPGVRFTELIPNVARLADRLALIRSMTHGSPDHNIGAAHTLEGRQPSGPREVYLAPTDRPAIGAVLHKLQGETGLLPPWVILPRLFTTLSPPIKGQSAGFLGSSFDAVCLNEPGRDSLAPKELRSETFDLPAGVARERLEYRRQFLSRLEDQDTSQVDWSDEGRWDDIAERATAMLSNERCARAFDLSREDPRLRDRYGRHEYGQSLLLARRLVESGVRFVNVFWTYFDQQGCQFNLWDNHGVTGKVCGVGGVQTGKEMLTHRYCTPSFDQAFPALIEDLENRGLLDETLVVVAGEFGRTPKINATAGRDHWPNCYTQLLAGGGIRGGQVYGESDRNAAYVKDKPVRPEDFHATILHAFGVPAETLLYDRLNRPFRASDGTPLNALFG